MDAYNLTQQLINGITLGSIYGLIAVGYTMVYGIIGMINFAHGDIYMISAYLLAIFFALVTAFGVDSAVLALCLTGVLVILFTALYGWTVERVAYRPLRGSTRLAPLISAIGMSLILQNYLRLSQGSGGQGFPALSEIEGVCRYASEWVCAAEFNATEWSHYVQISYIQIVIIIVAIISMAVLSYIIQKTSLGRACRATQQDPTMAEMLGINTDRIISTVFVIGASMAAIAGILVTLYYGSFDYNIGFVTGIKAFTAAVLGGIGSLPGAMLGGLVLGMSESLFSGFVNTDYKDVFAFVLLILVLIFKPSGLLGKPEIEKV